MRYDEVRKLITGSSPADWEVIEVEGNVYLDRFEGVSTGGGRSLKAESHIYMAIYKADIDLRLAWGMTEATGLSFEGWNFPHRSIERQLVDGFWRGAFVTRWPVLEVDDGRCYLPYPTARPWTPTGRPRATSSPGRTCGPARSPWPGCCRVSPTARTASSTSISGRPKRSSCLMRRSASHRGPCGGGWQGWRTVLYTA